MTMTTHRRRILPLADWPAEDQALWARLCGDADPLEDPGAFAGLRPATRENYRTCYGAWLSWYLAGEHPATGHHPRTRVTPAGVSAWLVSMDHLAASTCHQRVLGLERVVVAERGDLAFGWLRRLVRHLERVANNSPRKRHPPEDVTSLDLVRLGWRLIQGADIAGPPDLKAARAARDGLLILLLAHVPIRIGNYRDLRIGEHLVSVGHRFRIALSSSETKTHRPYEADIPDTLTGAVHAYLARFRPVLLRGNRDTRALWINDAGRPYTHHNLGARIANLTERHLGRRVTAHQFRHVSATTIARFAPEQAAIIPGVMGHVRDGTAETYYIRAGSLDASNHYKTLVEEIRKGASP